MFRVDAGGIGRADRQLIKGIGGSGNRHCAGPCPRRTARLRADATRRRTGGQHHHPGMDLAVRHGFWRGTDIGGPLSHSSIVAREYGIPAVLGTAVATRLIHSGQLITVDGDAGVVRLLDGQDRGLRRTRRARRAARSLLAPPAQQPRWG